MALKTMPIAKLQDLKSKIDAAINAKVSERRRELETELAKLAQFDGRRGKAIRSGRSGARGAVAPKYRNPENPAETWAGRAQAAIVERGDRRRDRNLPWRYGNWSKEIKRRGSRSTQSRFSVPTRLLSARLCSDRSPRFASPSRIRCWLPG